MKSSISEDLARDGLAIIPNLLSDAQLQSMQRSFESQLKRMRWNNFDGYEKTERYRHTVQDVLMLHQSFLEVALHPIVKTVLHEYLGYTFELVEAKGWKSLPTRRDFHGWHADSWYDQRVVRDRIPREAKLAVYLTDVKTGGFVYVKGTHGEHHPKALKRNEVASIARERIEITGPAGLAFLFDTSGIHRQSMPILEPRQAVFYCYHDPAVPLQSEDVEYYRYHPLHLNAAFLGNLADDDRRILGFGNKTNFQPGFEREPLHTGFQALTAHIYDSKLGWEEFRQRVMAKLRFPSREES